MQWIYLSRPMAGRGDFNYQTFNAEAARLRALGYTVENPAENPAVPRGRWELYMTYAPPSAIRQMLNGDTVAFLPAAAIKKALT